MSSRSQGFWGFGVEVREKLIWEIPGFQGISIGKKHISVVKSSLRRVSLVDLANI